MGVNWKNPFVKKVLGMIQHYDENTYWRLRKKVISSRCECNFSVVFFTRKENGCL